MAFNISYVYQAIDKFTPVANKIKRSTNAVKAKMKEVGKTAIAMGVALASGFLVKGLVDFDRSMSKVKAVSGATSLEFAQMRKVAKDLGATTSFSASEAASGMEFLARAGFQANDVISSMPAVLSLAASSSIDLGTAADITSNIMSGFNLKAEETIRIADLMATINASANTNIQQLGDGMKFVGPIAAGLGKSIEETAAALGVLADAGLQGSMGGTGLRQVLLRLSNPSNVARKAIAKMGLSMADINPQTKSLTEILDKFAEKGVSVAQAAEIFGDRGGPAFAVLTENIPKLRRLNGILDESKGKADAMATTMLDNLWGSAVQVGSAFEGLIITLGDLGLTAILRGVANGLTFIVRSVDTLLKKLIILKPIVDTIRIGFHLIRLAVEHFISTIINLTGALGKFLSKFEALKGVGNFFSNIGKGFTGFTKELGSFADYLSNQSVNPSENTNIAAQQATNRSIIEGNINVNAPPGVVNSVDLSSKGNNTNLGMSMAGAY